jgi:Uma2 family endonuclease
MMSVTVMPREYEWTVDDLDGLPDDGLQYELIDGILLVSPAPVKTHQFVVAQLFLLVEAACPPGLTTLFAPVDWRPHDRTSLQPDLLVMPREKLKERSGRFPMHLAVEVLSPSTRSKDQIWKRAVYEEAGVGAYWIVDPVEPSVEALVLVDGVYQLEARAAGDEVASIAHPFPVEVRPIDLIP